MTERPFVRTATDEGLILTFDPPISSEDVYRIRNLLAQEYRLSDAAGGSIRAESGSRRFNPGEGSGITELRVTSWRPHSRFPESLLAKVDRDVALILAGMPVEETHLTTISNLME